MTNVISSQRLGALLSFLMATDTKADLTSPRLPDELVASTTFLLKRLGFTAKEQAMQAFERSGLTPYHHAVLAVLDEGARETQNAIADALGYDRGQLVGLLDELEERGLVERRRDPGDRRRHTVTLTAAGSRALRKLRAIADALEHDFLAPLDSDQQQQLHALLRELAGKHLPRCSGPTTAAQIGRAP
jgi:DNA-binding MarR family transcriptional regulator